VPASPQAGDNRRLQSRIAEQLGGRTNFEQLAAQVLDMTEPLMARVYALRRLEDRFPIDVEAQLTAQDLDALRHLQREHLAALSQQTEALDQALKPVLPSKLRQTPAPAFSSTAWQPATEELFQSARHIEKMLAVMFGAAASDTIDPQQLPTDLAIGLAQLRAKVEGYSHLLANTEK